jgi:hypothetical protein
MSGLERVTGVSRKPSVTGSKKEAALPTLSETLIAPEPGDETAANWNSMNSGRSFHEKLQVIDLGRALLHKPSSLFRCWQPQRSGLPQALGACP